MVQLTPTSMINLRYVVHNAGLVGPSFKDHVQPKLVYDVSVLESRRLLVTRFSWCSREYEIKSIEYIIFDLITRSSTMWIIVSKRKSKLNNADHHFLTKRQVAPLLWVNVGHWVPFRAFIQMNSRIITTKHPQGKIIPVSSPLFLQFIYQPCVVYRQSKG